MVEQRAFSQSIANCLFLAIISWIPDCCSSRSLAEPPQDSSVTSEAWIRSLGGRVGHDATGAITSVDLRNAWLTDSDLKKISKLTALETIDLAYTKVTDEGLEQLKPLANVRTLNLHYAEYVTDTGIAHLKHWTQLAHLDLRGTKVTSTLFEHVVHMVSLRSLDVGFSRVNDDSFERLSELPNLEKFSFGGNKMSGTALPLLKLLPKLRELSVGGQQRTDSGLWSVNVSDFNVGNIADISDLRVLDLSGTAITDRGVSQLSRLKHLESLNLSRTNATSKGITALSGILSLRHLKLAQSAKLDDSVLIACQNFENLEVLELQETTITFEGLTKFSPKSTLKKIFIGGVSLTPEQVDTLRLGLPNCFVSWWPKAEIATEERL